MTSRECCLDSSEVSAAEQCNLARYCYQTREGNERKGGGESVLGLLRLALWPPITFPGLDMVIDNWDERFDGESVEYKFGLI